MKRKSSYLYKVYCGEDFKDVRKYLDDKKKEGRSFSLIYNLAVRAYIELEQGKIQPIYKKNVVPPPPPPLPLPKAPPKPVDNRPMWQKMGFDSEEFYNGVMSGEIVEVREGEEEEEEEIMI